jgi:hypothetical protein
MCRQYSLASFALRVPREFVTVQLTQALEHAG